MEEKNDIFDHLKPGKTPIPDASYFENLAKSVIDSQKEVPAKKETPIVPLYKRPALWIGAVAAVFIAGFLIVNFGKTAELDSDPLLALNDVSNTEVYNYIDENIDDFETDLIVEAMNESSVDELTFVEPEEDEPTPSETSSEATTVETISFDDIDAEDILNYFNAEGIDSEDFEDDDSFI